PHVTAPLSPSSYSSSTHGRLSSLSFFLLFFSLPPRPPISTLFPYTTLFRSQSFTRQGGASGGGAHEEAFAAGIGKGPDQVLHARSEEHTSELQSPDHLVCRLLLEKKKKKTNTNIRSNTAYTH